MIKQFILFLCTLLPSFCCILLHLLNCLFLLCLSYPCSNYLYALLPSGFFFWSFHPKVHRHLDFLNLSCFLLEFLFLGSYNHFKCIFYLQESKISTLLYFCVSKDRTHVHWPVFSLQWDQTLRKVGRCPQGGNTNLSALRARTGASSGRSRTGKMRMEAGGWLGHGGMGRGGVLTVQVRAEPSKHSCGYWERARARRRGRCHAQGKTGSCSLGYWILFWHVWGSWSWNV